MTAKLNLKERLRIIKRVTEDKEPVVSACKENEISRTLFYRWLNRYKNALKGEEKEALIPKKRRAYFAKNQIPIETEKIILFYENLSMPIWLILTLILGRIQSFAT